MSNELNCRMGKDELTWSGAWWRRQSCGWLVHWLGNASFFPSVLLCFLSWSWFLVSGNFENENVRKNGLLNAFSPSFFFVLVTLWMVCPRASSIYRSSMLPPVSFCSFIVCGETDEDDDIWSSCSAFPCFLGFFLWILLQFLLFSVSCVFCPFFFRLRVQW
jgi:hypothetical protein